MSLLWPWDPPVAPVDVTLPRCRWGAKALGLIHFPTSAPGKRPGLAGFVT